MLTDLPVRRPAEAIEKTSSSETLGAEKCELGTVAFYLTKLARLGGYLARSRDAPSGIVVIWRGLARLTDIELGAEVANTPIVGN